MPTGTPKAPGRRQKAFSCRPKWQRLSVFEFSTARALRFSIGEHSVFDPRSGMDQGLATGLGQAAFLTWSYGLASISRWRGAFSDLRDHSPTLYLRRRGHVAATRLERCCGGRWSISLRRGQPVTTQGDIAAPTPGDELSNGHGCSYLLLLPRSGNLIDPIDLAEFLQKLRVAVVQTHDPAELRAVAPFVLDDLAPDLDHAE